MKRVTVNALRRGHPLWTDGRKRSHPRYPRLNGHRTAEVAIVGGGLTGAHVALTFATAGVDVAVLEAGNAGRGSTVASSALLLKDPDRELGELADLYGASASRRIWRLCHEAVDEFVSMIRRHRIDCELASRDVVFFARQRDAAARLHTEFELRNRCGFKSLWLTPGTLRRTTGITGFGAIRSTGNAQLNPYEACVGLLRAAAASGAAVFERSRVTRIAPRPNGVRLLTRTGSVDAARVVIATGYATPQFRPLAGRFRMYRTYVLATRRVTSRQRRELGLGPFLIWDTERPYHYARWTADGRLLLGGADRPVRPGQRRAAQFAEATGELRQDFEQVFPALANVPIQTAWEGLFAVTQDSLPYIGPHRRYPRHLFALGYGGNGMTFASLSARLLLEYWNGARSLDQRLFAFDRQR